MNKFSFTLLIGLGVCFALQGAAFAQQKIGYVDIATIMKELPDAQDAQRSLDILVKQWQEELDKMEKEWQRKFNDYDKRKLILTDQGRANAERDLQALDAEIMSYRDAKFGQNGELFQKEDELMRPIQNIVFEQVKLLASEMGYDYVLDKSSGASIIYAKDSHDLTQKVIERIKKALPARDTAGSKEFESGTSGTNPGGSPPGGNQPPRQEQPRPVNPRPGQVPPVQPPK